MPDSLLRQEMIRRMEDEIAAEARRVAGADRSIVARFNEQTGWVDLFQTLTVVPVVQNAGREISLPDALHYDPESHVGSRVTLRISYRNGEENVD